MALSIRPAAPADAALIATLVRELAEFERLQDHATVTADDLAGALFAPNPRVFCDIAEDEGGRPVGFALWFYNFSTFQGRSGIYLEDLYVREAARGTGVGGALLQNLAKRCVAEGLGRLSWSVLDWNEQAIAFYQGLGARLTEEWILARLEGEALAAVASQT